MWVNSLPSGKCIYHKYSPREIVTGQHLDFKKHFRVVYGLYVEDHDDPNRTNNMSPRTHECISLVPTRNIQVTQKVFCMNSGGVLKIRNIVPMISSDRIIKTVE